MKENGKNIEEIKEDDVEIYFLKFMSIPAVLLTMI